MARRWIGRETSRNLIPGSSSGNSDTLGTAGFSWYQRPCKAGDAPAENRCRAVRASGRLKRC